MTSAASFKESGNVAFKQGKYMAAIDLYTKGLTAMHGQEQTEDSFDLVMTLFANRALACLKVGQPKAALEDCDRAISYDSTHIKVRFRRGLALSALGRIEDAKQQLASVITDGSVDEATRKLARDELAKLQPTKKTLSPVTQTVDTSSFVPSADAPLLSTSDVPINPGMFKEASVSFGGEDALELLKAAASNKGKMTPEQVCIYIDIERAFCAPMKAIFLFFLKSIFI